MDHHKGHTKPLHQQIYTIHHVHKVEPVPKLSGPHTTDARDQPEAAAIAARDNAITARDDADARTRVRPSPPAHHRLARLPPRHRLAASCPPFRMSARSAWACRAHSEPRRCRHLMPPQLQ
ncbi:hypothetical protein ACLOJK_002240 [Asimina triloba]